MPKVFVCVLNWNKRDDTLACLRSVFALDYPDLRVVVVDNGSTDGSLEALRGLGDRIDLVEHGDNRGFTGGCNAGMRHALSRGADYVWLLNNDCDVAPDVLSVLVDHAEAQAQIGLVSPVIGDRASRLDNFAVGRIDLGTGITEVTGDVAAAEAMQRRYPDQVLLKGTALLVKRQLIERIGYLDDRFFAYCEDNDYCMRCAAAGFRAVCVTAARVYHDEGAAEPGEPWRKPYAYYYAVRNGVLFWRKHAAGMARWRYGRWQACTMFRLLARGRYGRDETAAFADGLWCGVRGISGRWEPTQAAYRMPTLLRRLFVARPALFQGVLEGDARAALRGLLRRAG